MQDSGRGRRGTKGERKGKVRHGKERAGKERKGQKEKGTERKGKARRGTETGQRTQDTRHGARTTGRGTRDTGHRRRDAAGDGTRDTGHGTRDTGHGTRDAGRAGVGVGGHASAARVYPPNNASRAHSFARTTRHARHGHGTRNTISRLGDHKGSILPTSDYCMRERSAPCYPIRWLWPPV